MSLADFLFTPTLQRVLQTVLLSPERTFTLTQLLHAAGPGRGNTVKQIDRLVEVGVLQEAPREGRNRRISANPAFELYPELVSIMRKTFGIKEPIAELLAPHQTHIQEAFIYGSSATGAERHGSDIDLMVIADDALDYAALKTEALQLSQSLAREINLTVYGPKEWTRLQQQDSIVQAIAQGPKLEIAHAETPR